MWRYYAVNVGGTGKLPMSELKTMCEVAGFEHVRTYIDSGNVLFNSRLGEPSVRKRLEKRLADYAGKPVEVLVRTADEMAGVLSSNPFSKEHGNRVVAIFLDAVPAAKAWDEVTGKNGERLALGRREIYVPYGDDMDNSRLRIRAAAGGTGRNMNTVAKLASVAVR